MNKLLLPILLLFSSFANAQKPIDSTFTLKQLPALVTNQWKFHAGDDAAWADTAFDDHSWQHIDAAQLQHFLPQVTNAQIGWFRLSINVSPSLRGQTVALIINQSGAADVYFNGSLIRSMGKISADLKTGQTYRSFQEPITIQLSKYPTQYIAIRYSFDKSLPVIGYGEPVLTASIQKPDTAWEHLYARVDYFTTRSWVSGCFMLLGILQLAIYLLNRQRKANLYLSVYAFLQLLTLVNGVTGPIFRTYLATVIIRSIFCVTAPLEFLFLLMMTCEFFGYARDWRFKTAALLCPVIITLQFLRQNLGDEYILYAYNLLNYGFIISITTTAVREKKPGAKLLLFGIIASAILFTQFSLGDFWLPQSLFITNIEVALTFLLPAVVLAILLAREFSQNFLSLQQKLIEVQSLSARSLQQEVEKQQILASINETLEQKVAERTLELNRSLADLKAAQRQLVQSEKMASLGELTAGIAHEIQNPLNFVNNFSDVNKEMLVELREELDKGDIEEAKAIAVDIEQNEAKINHHGKRADAIVKGMLQHSRTSSGQKEPTDINALADEHLRLAYHGLRAKDNSFSAELVTGFDENIPAVNIVPQDIGRVILNLLNNAFYATQQKAKTAGPAYEPTVKVTTSLKPGFAEVRVKDNGNGIPENIKEKILQPFFTTKPTGEGTGLGLSLSYDIVVKAHGGKIDIKSKEGEGSEFIVQLPIN
ncbi:MAG: histidine kinase [Bacteroidetes bacterium]|nr:histidine kinase [Bacteroidota bacterium]